MGGSGQYRRPGGGEAGEQGLSPGEQGGASRWAESKHQRGGMSGARDGAALLGLQLRSRQSAGWAQLPPAPHRRQCGRDGC